MPASNAVIDLAAYRQRRQQQRSEPQPVALPVTAFVWVMVPVLYYPGYF